MSNLSSNIKYIVFLMLENRSFDNLLGWCYDGATETKLNHIPPLVGATFNGLTKPLRHVFEQPLTRALHSRESHDIVRGVKGSYSPNQTPWVDPEESYEHVTKQLFGPDRPDLSKPPGMHGFLQNFYNTWGAWSSGTYLDILNTYDPFATTPEAPIINFLASNFGVSDMWFSSIPSQTSINRAFSLTGNSVGWKTKPPSPLLMAMVDNVYYGTYAPAQFVGPTIFDVLYEHQDRLKNLDAPPDDWRIYYSNVWPPGVGKTSYTYQMFPRLQETLKNFGDVPNRMMKPIDQFCCDLAKGDLAAFTYLEPDYSTNFFGDHAGYVGNDYHPPADITHGEAFLTKLYTEITRSKLWDEMLFIISFDEHGGTFDHVAPPSGAVDPSPQYKPAEYQLDFMFDRFGVRVPTIFVSPWVRKNTVIRSSTSVPFDHTSLLSTLLDWFNLGSLNSGPAPALGQRTAAAPSFAPVISSTRRTDIPKLPPITEPDLTHVGARTNGEFTAAIALIAARNLAAERGVDDEREILRDILATCKTARDLAEYVRAKRVRHAE